MNYVPRNWTNWMQWINSQKHTAFQKLNQEESEHLNRQIIPNKIEAVTKTLPTKKALNWMTLQLNFTEHSKKN